MSEIVRANSNNSFLQKFLLISIVLIAFGFWFLYDATVGYPHKAVVAEKYETIQAEDISEDAKIKKWEKVAKEHGWSHSKPEHTAKEWHEKIVWWQYPLSLASFLCGIPVLINYLKSRNSWIESDGKSLTTSWGKSFRFDHVTKINKQSWEVKGIAKLELKTNDGMQKFKMDDFKYDRDAIGKILGQIESVAGLGVIVNGKSQVVLEAETARKRAAKEAAIEKEEAEMKEDQDSDS